MPALLVASPATLPAASLALPRRSASAPPPPPPPGLPPRGMPLGTAQVRAPAAARIAAGVARRAGLRPSAAVRCCRLRQS